MVFLCYNLLGWTVAFVKRHAAGGLSSARGSSKPCVHVQNVLCVCFLTLSGGGYSQYRCGKELSGGYSGDYLQPLHWE